MISLKVHFELEVAHRLFNVNTYSEECRDNLHGHSYRCDVEVSRIDGKLDASGMICDFKKLKEIIKVFEKKYDHSVIVKSDDPLCKPLIENCKKVHTVELNPTAEWMSKTFSNELNILFNQNHLDVEVISLEIAETSGNIAVWRK